MEYLRSAASAVLAKSTGPLPNYTVGAPFDIHHRSSSIIWQIHHGTKRDDGSSCTILIFDSASDPNDKAKLIIAKNAARKLRTLRHPDVLKLLDSAETPTAVYIAVEPIRQLQPVLDNWTRNGGTPEGKLEWIAWGLSRIANALRFINVDAGAVHGNVRPEAIFLSQAGEWRLAGFELLTAKADLEGVIWNLGGIVPDASLYSSPEVKQDGWRVLRDHDSHVLDSYSFALLAFSAYNNLTPSSNITFAPPQGSIPSALYTLLCRMLTPNPKNRLSVARLVETANADGALWKDNRLARLSADFENFLLASERERNESIRLLQSSSASLPADFLSHRILPSLVHALDLSQQPSTQHGGASVSNAIHAAVVLSLILQLGSSLSDSEWTSAVLPSVLKAYTSPDRSVRITLLDALPTYIDRIGTKRISDSIWPNFVTGFADSNAAIREGTLKAILPLSSKLTDRICNNELLRQLAKTQVDVEPSIRTNTTILLGRLAPNLSLSTRKSVLIPAFSRSLKDPFVHARVAGLMALMATSDSYDKDDLAKSVLPSLCPKLVDNEKLVRDQAQKALEVFWGRIKEQVKAMPDTVLSPPSDANGITETADGGTFATNANGWTSFEGSAAKGSGPGRLASTAGAAASTLAGWAMSGAMNYFSDAVGGAQAMTTPTQGPSTLESLDNKQLALPLGLSHSSRVDGPSKDADLAQSSLGATRNVTLSALPPECASSSDLIDMEDDTADWTAFESAPMRKPLFKPTPGRTTSANSVASVSSSLGRKVNLGTRPSTGNSSRRRMSSTGVERLKIGDQAGAADDAAWNNRNDEFDDAGTKGQAATSSAAAAFTTPLPLCSTPRSGTHNSAIHVTASSQTAECSSDFPDEDAADMNSRLAPQSASAKSTISKEEKRVLMERQREERRERMRKLKESKGKKLWDSLA